MPFWKKSDSAASSKHASPLSTPSPRCAVKTFQTGITPERDMGLPVSPLLSSKGGTKGKGSISPSIRSLSYAEQLSGDLGSYNMLNDAHLPAKSQLSKTLSEVLSDKDALCYFIQHMESRDAGHIIRFWLDAESFQAATWTRIRSHSLNTMSHSSIAKSPVSTQINDQKVNDAKSETSVNCTESTVNHSPNMDESLDKSKMDDAGAVNPSRHERGSVVYLDLKNEDHFAEKLRKSIEKDAVAIYSRYISLDATRPIGITDELRNETIHKICCEDGRVDPLCFVDCQQFVFNIMQTDYFEQFTRSEFYCQHQIDFLTSGDVKITDIIYNDAAMFYFMEYIEIEGGSNLLQFLMSADNFEQLLTRSQNDYDAIQAQDDAMVLYDKYFSLQASSPLGFGDKIRFQIESNICREGGPLSTCFHTARSIILSYMNRHLFKQFLSSELYFKYLSELINTIQSSQDVVQSSRHQRRANSGGDDASSEHSQGAVSSNSERTRNTLLATDTSAAKRVLNLKTDDFRIDMGSILNPQALWQRDNSGNLTLGHIDSMGHFVSSFDREPATKSESFFAKKRRDKDKTQEEMALKIAQMIINDVTSINDVDDDDGEGT